MQPEPRPDPVPCDGDRRLYSLHGLCLDSQLPLPAPLADTRPPDAHVRLGPVPRHLSNTTLSGSLFEAGPGEYLLRIPGVANYWVRRGSEIMVKLVNDADVASLVTFLIGSALTALLHQRGGLVLHASAVVGRRGAVLLVGHSGRGKSTLAAALSLRGYPLLTDELAVVTGADQQLLVQAGLPQVGLWPDAMLRFGHDPAVHRSPRPGIAKRIVPAVAGACQRPQPLAAIWILDVLSSDTVTTEAVEHAAAFDALRQHTRIVKVMEAMGMQAAHFRLASQVAATVPITRVFRPRGLDSLDQLVALIEPSLL